MRYTKKACSQGMSEGLSLQVTIASIGSLFFHQNVHVKSEWIFFIVFDETILESHLISNIQLKSNCFLHEAGNVSALNVRKSKFVAILKLQLSNKPVMSATRKLISNDSWSFQKIKKVLLNQNMTLAFIGNNT